jgi:hypothetical protein
LKNNSPASASAMPPNTAAPRTPNRRSQSMRAAGAGGSSGRAEMSKPVGVGAAGSSNGARSVSTSASAARGAAPSISLRSSWTWRSSSSIRRLRAPLDRVRRNATMANMNATMSSKNRRPPVSARAW